ncbi:MAG: nitrilase-related carbon-nitrogen hydrolase [Candidatus Methylomirabilota bacterium]
MSPHTSAESALTVAGIQLACGEEKTDNLAKALDLARVAAEQGAKIIAFPECFAWPWFPRKAAEGSRSLAEPIPGPFTQTLSLFAEQHRVVLVAPMFEAAEPGVCYNTTVVVDSTGHLLGLYRKNHVPDLPGYQERFYFRPGNLGFPVFKTRFATIAVQTCWDNFFPEGARAVALKGAQILFAPTACSAPAGNPMWERAILGHAVYNSLYVFRVNRIGVEGTMAFYGKSFCADPTGDFVAEPAGAIEGVVLADLDLGRIKLVRDDWTFLRDRRPEIYTDLV